VQNNHIGLAIVAVLVSVISAFYYLRPSVAMFFYPPQSSQNIIQEIPFTATISITICTALVLYMGLNPDMFITLAQVASVNIK